MSAIAKTVNRNTLVERYIMGDSEKKISNVFGVSRQLIVRELIKRNIKRRSMSESIKLAFSKTTPEFRIKMTEAAHNACRGRKVSSETKIKHAQTIEKNLTNVQAAESDLAKMLTDTGLDVTQQKAIGIYNIDIAINKFSVAVEIFDGGWHLYGSHLARFFERTKYILDQGWSVVIVWLKVDQPKSYTKGWPLTTGARDYLTSFCNFASFNPSFVSQYRVINGYGKLLTGIKSYLFDDPTVKRLTSTNQFSFKPDSISR
jgi:very-short-patch-repair endonuclease